MVSRLILGITVSLALLLSPVISQPALAKSSKKKSATASVKKKSGKKATYSSRKRSRESSRRAVADDGDTGSSYSPSYYRSSICETPPLMKIIPQRDGKFLMEPLAPKRAGSGVTTTPYTTPYSSGSRKTTVPGRDDYSSRSHSLSNSLDSSGTMSFPRWNFPDMVLTMAQYYKGAPYSRGGRLDTSGSTDCSGFVQYIYQGFKINLPRSSSEQAQVGKTISQNLDYSKLLPGDLLFFRRGGRSVGHAGIYMGNGKMIHASNHRNGVTVTDLNQPYYQSTFVVAKRVFEVKHPD